MKKIYRFLILSILCASTLTYTSCETFDLDQTASPDNANDSQFDVQLFLNSIQTDFAFMMRSFNSNAADLARIEYMFGRTYINNYPPSTLNFAWQEAYQGIFQDMVIFVPAALDAELYHHAAVAETIKAYTLVTLVDFLGDVPFSEANNIEEFPFPTVDSGASVYQAALDLLTTAETHFNTTPLSGLDGTSDFYYDGDVNKWQRLINTLRMKIYLQTRLVDANAMANFNAIAATGNYLSSNDDDFEFQFGTSALNPDTRHPQYTADYTNGAGAYQSNWLMYTMLGDDAADASYPGGDAHSTLPRDPRIQYYFTRMAATTPGQDGTAGDQQTMTCSIQPIPTHLTGEDRNLWCGLTDGYWGRTHGNDEGTPPDNFLRTAYGVYPAGGIYDDGDFEPTALGAGGGGAGIHPILLSSFVDFMLAEADMVAGNEAAALIHVQDGLTKHIEKVQGYGALDITVDPADFPTAADVTAFINAVGNEWNNGDTTGPADTDMRWNLLAEEYFVTQFGAGMDAYNFYRRTGYPTSLATNIDPNPGNFVRSFFYPDNETSANSNIAQKANHDVQVFWDNNPASPAFPPAN